MSFQKLKHKIKIDKFAMKKIIIVASQFCGVFFIDFIGIVY